MTAKYDPRAYPPFAVAVDIVVFTVEDGILKVALIERGEAPHKGSLALPGGFVQPDEELDTAAARELEEETGLSLTRLQQFGAYGAPDRDPRMRVVSIAYWTITPDLPEPVGGTDAATARKVALAEVLDDPGSLRFDHHQILSDALEEARNALEDTTVATRFCGPKFTISELRYVYETVWGVQLDQGNFQNKVVGIDGFVIPTGTRQEGGRGRPAELFRAGPAERIEPPFRRPHHSERVTPSMNIEGFIDRVDLHLKRLGIEARPTHQEYVNAWNSQVGAKKLAQTFSRRRRKSG